MIAIATNPTTSDRVSAIATADFSLEDANLHVAGWVDSTDVFKAHSIIKADRTLWTRNADGDMEQFGDGPISDETYDAVVAIGNAFVMNKLETDYKETEQVAGLVNDIREAASNPV